MSTAPVDLAANRIVPPTGTAAWLTLFASGVMAALAVFTLAIVLAAGDLARQWSDALARTSTIRIAAPQAEREAQVAAVLRILGQTPGISAARALTADEQQDLLTPWFGPDLPLDTLPIPALIEVTETGAGYDAEGLRQRLTAEVPGAVLDDHDRWRRPLVRAASRLRTIGWLALTLMAGTTAAIVTLAAKAALAANAQVIGVMRLIGARDVTIARAFVRRFTLRALVGAIAGAFVGMVFVALLPGAGTTGATILEGLGLSGFEWVAPILVPPFAALVAFWATRFAALGTLRRLT